MKLVLTFLRRVSLYLLPVLAGLGWLEYQQHILPNDYKAKKALMEAGLERWETLILGSSHSYLGLNPDYFPTPAFNLAYTAQTLYYDRFLLEKYLDQMPRLQSVIVPISYSSFATESYVNPGDYNKSYHYAYFYGSTAFVEPLNPRLYSLNSLFSVRRAVDRTIDYYGDDLDLVEFQPNGWYDSEQSGQRDLERNAKDAAQFHDFYYNERFYPANIGYIVEMARLCRERGVQLYLITTPHWHGYLENVRAERLARMTHTADSLSQALNVPYWDYLRDEQFGEEYFFDSNHLAPTGAARFSEMLAQKIGFQSK